MAKINMGRVGLGGVAAAAVIFVLTGVLNGAILASQLQAWLHGMGDVIHPPAQPAQMGLWALMCLVDGAVGVWIYAAIRPRFGAGPKTALLAGLAVWMVGRLAVTFDLTALGLFPAPIALGQLLGGLVAILGGVFVGAWLYRE
jgi:hypothetical protein